MGRGSSKPARWPSSNSNNPLVQLIVKNDKGTPEGAAAAASEAIAEGAEIIVGPISAAATSAVAPVARKANVPVLSFSNDRRVAGNGVYLLSTLPEQEVDRIVSYTVSQGRRSIAALVPNSESAQIFETALRTSIDKQKASLASSPATRPNRTRCFSRPRLLREPQTGGLGTGRRTAGVRRRCNLRRGLSRRPHPNEYGHLLFGRPCSWREDESARAPGIIRTQAAMQPSSAAGTPVPSRAAGRTSRSVSPGRSARLRRACRASPTRP